MLSLLGVVQLSCLALKHDLISLLEVVLSCLVLKHDLISLLGVVQLSCLGLKHDLISLLGVVQLSCLVFPKLYTVLFKPEKVKYHDFKVRG